MFTMPSLFENIPIIKFIPQEDMCCDQILNVLKTKKRTVATLSAGTFRAHQTVMVCSQ